MAKYPTLDTVSGYDRWSEVYDHDRNPLVLLEEPLVREWIGSARGKRVVDVGCGTGRHSLWLAQSGARVDALDPSPGMMSKAHGKLRAHGVRLHHHALPEPLPVPGDTFDIALLALVADHLADLRSAFDELRRVTRTGGMVVFTVMHPALNLRGVSARFVDPDHGGRIQVASHRHSVADYVMAAVRSGLRLDDMIERSADADLAARTPRAAKYLGWPMLLALRLHKPPSGPQPSATPRSTPADDHADPT